MVNLRTDPYDVYIGRTGRGFDGTFGNPVEIGHMCLECGETHVEPGSTLPCYARYLVRRTVADVEFRNAVGGLRGRVLGCFCKPGPCHGDVLAVFLATQGYGVPAWVCGSRDLELTPYELQVLGDVFDRRAVSAVIHGGARGIDAAGGQLAADLCLPSVVIRPEWDRIGKRAGRVRNEHLARLTSELGGVCIAVYRHQVPTRGTAHAMECARARGIPLYRVQIESPGVRLLPPAPI